MKKKILASFLLIIILFTNCSWAANINTLIEYPIVDGTCEYNNGLVGYTPDTYGNILVKASALDENTYVGNEYDAQSLKIPKDNIKIYDYDTTNIKQRSESPTVLSNTNKKYYYKFVNSTSGSIQSVFATFKIANDKCQEINIATINYKEAVQYNGNKYNLKANIKAITSPYSEQEVMIKIGERNTSTENVEDISTYTNIFYPSIGAVGGTHTEIRIDWFIQDENGNLININGLLGVTDVDCEQGFYLEDFVANKQNTYATGIDSGYAIDQSTGEIVSINDGGPVGIKIVDNKDTMIKANSSEDTSDKNVFMLINNKNRLNTIFTFNSKTAYSNFVFMNNAIKRYKIITTSVTGGIITPTKEDVKEGDNIDIVYSPNDSERQYLKSVKVDSTDVDLNDNKDKYTFTNVTENHTVDVVYGNKFKVTYDAKGGTPTPDTEYVMPSERATQPTSNPVKSGYTFGGWSKTGDTEAFNYNNQITEDINLEAKWTPEVYNINYVLNEGINSTRNPGSYTVESNIDLQPATRTGYDFLGWYEDENFNTKIDSISNRTGNITVYAKWQNNQQAQDPDESNKKQYKIEHYKETTNGEYELAVTDTLTGSINDTVNAEAKSFTGFYEDKTNTNRLDSGKIMEDGSLTLKLYYNKNQYTVSFEPKNNTKINSQKIQYQEKAKEPSKPTMSGYSFQYWYYINDDNEEVRYNFDDPVTEDVELIAKWEKQTVVEKENTISTTTKKATESTPSSLPRTGFAISSIIILTVITGIAIVFFGNKYKYLKDIK